MTDSISFQDNFNRHMNIGSNERPRMLKVEGDAYEFSRSGASVRRERNSHNDVYNSSIPSSTVEKGQFSHRMGTGKHSGVASSAQYYNTNEGDRNLMDDFKRHFNNRGRQQTPQNHHDFLDVIRQQRESIDHS